MLLSAVLQIVNTWSLFLFNPIKILLAVLGSSERLGKDCTQLPALLSIKAGDKEDYLEGDGKRNCLDLPKMSY